MTFAMWDELHAIARRLRNDRELRVLVIAGAGGKAFVSGTDIAGFRGFTAEDGVAYEARMDAVIGAVEALDVPVVAAVAGACTGGGVALAAACDVRIGASSARVGVPIARTLGNVLSLANIMRVSGVVGSDAVKAMLVTAELLDAESALRTGFFHELVDDAQLDARAAERAETIAALAPLTLRLTKAGMRRLRAAVPIPDDGDLIRAAYGSADFAEGVDAFIAKRAPRWTGSG